MARKPELREWKKVLCSSTDIAEYAGVTRAQITHWAKMPWFPEPIDEPCVGRIWSWDAVVKALEEEGYPRSGFRRRTAASE